MVRTTQVDPPENDSHSLSKNGANCDAQVFTETIRKTILHRCRPVPSEPTFVVTSSRNRARSSLAIRRLRGHAYQQHAEHPLEWQVDFVAQAIPVAVREGPSG